MAISFILCMYILHCYSKEFGTALRRCVVEEQFGKGKKKTCMTKRH